MSEAKGIDISMKEKVKVVIATHKNYEMPSEEFYLPVHVGAEGKVSLGYQGDNTGKNISEKNATFCELTGLYWAWKNIDSEYIGLVHYRRHFTLKSRGYRKKHTNMECVLSDSEILKLIDRYDVILPKKQKYIIETLYSHYAHTHYKEHLDETRNIIAKLYPEFLVDYDAVMKQRSGHMFNMFIMKKEYVDEYCQWLFDILFELEKRMGQQYISPFQGRFYGRVSEIALNCWLRHKKRTDTLQIKKVPVFYLEKIDWNRKIKSFFAAKFAHKKYRRSF